MSPPYRFIGQQIIDLADQTMNDYEFIIEILTIY